jgi:diacylglycerol diphosphate phosphatase/phosphatidate phosphatase
VLVWTGVWVPIFIVSIIAWRSPNRNDLLPSLSGLFTAVGVSEGCTQMLKLYVSRKRPNFYALCGWSMQQLQCTAPYLKQVEAQLSFPSGHSSLSFCTMTYLVFYFLGNLGLRRNNYCVSLRFCALACCVLPWGWAAIVGASRIVDYWHHPSDVVAGTMLGAAVGTASYHFMYPNVFSANGGTPLSVLTAQAEKLPSFHE